MFRMGTLRPKVRSRKRAVTDPRGGTERTARTLQCFGDCDLEVNLKGAESLLSLENQAPSNLLSLNNAKISSRKGQ